MSKEQYDDIAEEYSQMLNSTKRYVLIPTFKKLVGDVTGKSALDLACGEGFFTRILAQLKPAEVVGIDISNELIKKAIEIERQNHLGIKYEAGDVLKLNLNRTFDLVSAVYLLNYSQTYKELEIMCKKVYEH
jgi:2-polyprenyl-3-methyl-5-hydroxy-6-metoxy-1,4-benzoquinol methylase